MAHTRRTGERKGRNKVGEVNRRVADLVDKKEGFELSTKFSGKSLKIT